MALEGDKLPSWLMKYPKIDCGDGYTTMNINKSLNYALSVGEYYSK